MARFELDVNDLSTRALSVLRAALKRARDNPSLRSHSMSLTQFYRLAGLPQDMPFLQFLGLIKEVKKTAIFSHDFVPGEFSGWLAFERIETTESHLEFTLCPHTLDATEPREFLSDRHMSKLNEGLKIALAQAGGDAEGFAFHLTAVLGAWMGEGGLDEDVAWATIQLLHQLHPSISI